MELTKSATRSVCSIFMLLFISFHAAKGAFIQPQRHTLPDGLQSLSGSDVNGGCPTECVMSDGNGRTCQCSGNVPINSTLIDGVCPSLIDTAQPDWASELFTINRNEQTQVRIGFMSSTPFMLRGVELRLFNCATERTAIHTINVYSSFSYPSFNPFPTSPIGSYTTTGDDLSCNSLTTVIISTNSSTTISASNHFVEFEFPQGDTNTGIFIAEARFSDTTITMPTDPPDVSSPTMEPSTTTLATYQPSPSPSASALPTTSAPSPTPLTSSALMILPSTPIPTTATVQMSNGPLDISVTNEVSVSPLVSPLPATSAPSLIPLTSTVDSTLMIPLPTPIPTTTSTTATSSTVVLMSTQTTSNILTPLDTTGATDQSATLSTDLQLGAIIGSLVVIIVILIIAIILSVVIAAVCINRNKRKFDLYHLQGVISETSLTTNNRNYELNRRSFANNQYYEETVYRRVEMTQDGYSMISINSCTEPIYHTVDESRELVEKEKVLGETLVNEDADKSFYQDVNEGNSNFQGYSKVAIKEPPLIPKKTPELYHDLKLEEAHSQSIDSSPSLVVYDENDTEIETVENTGDNENAYQGINFAKSASVQSGLAILSKPVFKNMDSNPTYESPELVRSPLAKLGPSSDLIYTNPDAVDKEIPTDDVYTDTLAPSKPHCTHHVSLSERNTDDTAHTEADKSIAIYSEPDNDTADTNAIYTDPDKVLKPKIAEEIYADPDQELTQRRVEEVYTDPDQKISSEISPTTTAQEGLYTDPDLPKTDNDGPAEVIYSVADDAQGKHTSIQESEYSLAGADPTPADDDIYTDPDARKAHLEALPAIYDTIYQESGIAAIFDPDAVPAVYENTISDEDLFPYAPIYADTAVPEGEILELTSDNIRKVRELGSGCFGQVFLAETVGLSLKDLGLSRNDDESTQVAVKTLKSTASLSTKESFKKEYKFMSRLAHPHVIQFLGVCKTDPQFIMMEYLKHGDLESYLKKIDSIVDFDTTNPAEISVKTLISMCTQIADAMNYLATRNYIHRDLAARNCLVGDSNIVKLSDFGMSKNLYESHYYIIKGRAVLPVRWMSSECFYGKFSVNSDIWAFGVTMWEIFVLSKRLPYEDLTDVEVAKDALKGEKRRILLQPEKCPQEVYDVMLRCWAYLPKVRVPFDQLFKELTSLIENNSDDELV